MVKRLSNTDQDNNKLINIPTPIDNGDAVNKQYVDTGLGSKVNKSGDTMTGPLVLSGLPTLADHAATKAYVDSITGGSGLTWKYVTSSTASGTATKTGTTTAGTYTPTLGDLLMVTFTSGVNVNTPTLNIDGSGAKNIRIGNVNVSTAIVGTTSSVIIPLWYDGTYYQMFGSHKNDNTTYTEITEAEITTGTASTARAISGRRAQFIVDKARTGVVKSTTTDKITVSSTEPGTPTAGDLWFDNSTLPENLAPNSIIWKETPAGAVNGINFAFQTAQPYVSGSLQGFINGIAQSGYITETGPGSGVFEFDVAPLTGDDVRVQYQVRSTSLGNAATLDNVTLNGLLEALYPVGATYISGSSTMPALIAGVGTWVRLKGRVIVGLDEDQTEFDTINETGGHKLMQSHNHGIGTLRPLGNAGHADNNATNLDDFAGSNGPIVATGTPIGTGAWSGAMAFTGGGDSQNLQPYKVKYMWERTA